MHWKAIVLLIICFSFSCSGGGGPEGPNGGSSSDTVVSTPTFSPSGGSHSQDIQVLIVCATSGAIVHYTTNGDIPTTSSDAYSSPIDIAGDGTHMTIRAMAVKDGMQNSTVAMAEYTIDGSTPAYGCDNPHSEWLFCEDFEAGDGDFDTWFANSDFLSGPGTDDRGRIRLASDVVHSGRYAIHMPADSGSGYQGAGLDWWACDGEQQTNCNLRSYDQLYFRAWVRFADDHRYIHHFLNISGSQPNEFWYKGLAGCLPDGMMAMGTTVDYRQDTRESFFYTYHPEMTCDTRCERYADVDSICQECLGKGLPTCTDQPQCCWGKTFAPEPAVVFPVGEWFCLEMMMKANTPGEHDGEMAYWINGELAHRVTDMMWRVSPTLALNRVRLQHYITSSDARGHSNRVWFDDIVVSTSPIGMY
jgi:hypothetical protein